MQSTNAGWAADAAQTGTGRGTPAEPPRAAERDTTTITVDDLMAVPTLSGLMELAIQALVYTVDKLGVTADMAYYAVPEYHPGSAGNREVKAVNLTGALMLLMGVAPCDPAVAEQQGIVGPKAAARLKAVECVRRGDLRKAYEVLRDDGITPPADAGGVFEDLEFRLQDSANGFRFTSRALRGVEALEIAGMWRRRIAPRLKAAGV